MARNPHDLLIGEAVPSFDVERELLYYNKSWEKKKTRYANLRIIEINF